MDNYNSMFGLLVGFGAFAIFSLLIAIAAYIVCSLANNRILKYYNHKNSWAAWIPIYNYICLTECIEENSGGKVKVFSWLLPKKYVKLWPLIILVPMFVSFLTFPVVIANMVFTVLLYKILLEQESNKDETLLAIVSTVFPIVWVVLGFARFKGLYEPHLNDVSSDNIFVPDIDENSIS